MSALSEACDDIAAWLPRAAVLIGQPDADGTASGGKPGSSPPWNPAAAAAAMDAREGLRRLEASLRLAVTGRTGQRRGGSDANTIAAIAAIEALGEGVTARAAATAARILARWSIAVQQLPAIDQAERWHPVPAPCPYCGLGMLRVAPKAGKVTCMRFGACFDTDGRHPVGTMEIGRLGAQVRWSDGLVAP